MKRPGWRGRKKNNILLAAKPKDDECATGFTSLVRKTAFTFINFGKFFLFSCLQECVSHHFPVVFSPHLRTFGFGVSVSSPARKCNRFEKIVSQTSFAFWKREQPLPPTTATSGESLRTNFTVSHYTHIRKTCLRER